MLSWFTHLFVEKNCICKEKCQIWGMGRCAFCGWCKKNACKYKQVIGISWKKIGCCWKEDNNFLSDPGMPGVRSMGPSLSNSLTEWRFADFTELTLNDEDTNSILTDSANRAIQGNVAMQVTRPGGQLWKHCKGRHLMTKFWTNLPYILKGGARSARTPQTILNFPQKDCLRTRKVSKLHCT